MSKPTIFIDGEAGTTGLQIRARLRHRRDLALVSIDPARRKDEAARRDLLNSVDLAVLCLPDDAAREALRLIDNPQVRVLDASSAHRVQDGWTYGFPELTRNQAQAIGEARFVSNPGCYATGMIALVRPLVDAGLLPADYPLSVQGASGYSGGGRSLVDAMEGRGGEHPLAGPYRAYALELAHKHAPEMQRHGGLSLRPLFTPAVGAWRQGMLIQVPLHLRTLGGVTASELHGALQQHYAGQRFVQVMPLESNPAVLDPEALADTNQMELFVYHNEHHQVLLMARLDNLGKGASGAAAQNVDLMLGLTGDHSYTVHQDTVQGSMPAASLEPSS
ncbi:N-acetyl-gamma-glutamyl-phosphate reductase [Deinococcus peraridilitoris]|uniref:N-acetyl-gamma-glutamyl-phosphate reductase n=1 Tax=Deinococcus peraridilitoris (strain DSM 19664 / LMG 22246 / CIP 109416 / KR-200) TaxID=937777 RepID=L0A579_DEIPD|nr:N-acetyl-gamma-glutamyl-phosphate reductase [Deinococcus peraridilitoris]AFZ68150.1 N-acetyl-gamma-glutamyl-phosphate reductase, uncommon form [Deinococcus peraridilitoris DSM 19664]